MRTKWEQGAMRKDGRGHGDHDHDPRSILSTVFAIVAPLALATLICWRWG
ncbi:hypothetical protein [Hansschlegelia beijingensis]|uniref:Uncharacterized protein n=1 Tax=Hansschlegelia beijingensis TaxID=1133344 RepID=A0A7W6D5V9_9HYPH|nr:hypothetical protein [Hansschlegelia beijingensis]MBB3972809.1 hypothetical protein [Hansschlegelia beijingensis]